MNARKSTDQMFRSSRHSPDPILTLTDVSVEFKMDRGSSRVLDDINIDIYPEEIFGIVGESGSGKSMLASSLLDAVVDPGVTEGNVKYHPQSGEPVDVLSLTKEELRRFRWEEISMVFQGAMNSFNPVNKIREHFEETLEAHEYEIEDGMEYAQQLLSDLYLDPDRVLDSYPHELSGGMKQRALIALSLLLEPEVLVMDEPTAALDLLMQRSILSLLDDLQKKYDLTVVFITHDLPLVAGLADRLGVMYAFNFVEVGPAREMIETPTHPYTRALLKAVPNLESDLATMQPVEGSAPDPVNIPSGCSYHPRCPLATEQCEIEDPSYFNVDDSHKSACFHWEESADAIPLEHEAGGTTEESVGGTQTDDPVVSLNDVSVHFEQSLGIIESIFGEPDVVRAVDDVTLDIYGNDVIALVGESGCGKTTLGETAIGVQEQTNGTVKYRGQNIHERPGEGDISQKKIRQSLQMIQQDPSGSLNPNRTVRATLHAPLKHWQPELNRSDREERIRNMLEYVGMSPAEDYAERYPHQLSGGEKQRVALIRALLMEPDVILADEAVSALDVSLRIEMMDLMLELQRYFDTSYLFISHDLANARYIAGKAGGRIGVMYLGELVEIGDAEEIINNPKHPYTKMLVWSTSDLDFEEEIDNPPIRNIDIPDPVDPPSGCRFHTRCPEAREVCTTESPVLTKEKSTGDQHVACFRDRPTDHEYWDSRSIVDSTE